MERRSFLAVWVLGILYAIFPSLRPKLAPTPATTYGGMDLRELLRGNSEFRTLEIPYMIEDGVPLGLVQREELRALGPIDHDRIRSLRQGWSLGLHDEKAGPGKITYGRPIEITEQLCTTGTTGGTRVMPAS